MKVIEIEIVFLISLGCFRTNGSMVKYDDVDGAFGKVCCGNTCSRDAARMIITWMNASVSICFLREHLSECHWRPFTSGESSISALMFVRNK